MVLGCGPPVSIGPDHHDAMGSELASAVFGTFELDDGVVVAHDCRLARGRRARAVNFSIADRSFGFGIDDFVGWSCS